MHKNTLQRALECTQAISCNRTKQTCIKTLFKGPWDAHKQLPAITLNKGTKYTGNKNSNIKVT